MCAVLRTLRYEKHLWQFSLNYRLHSFLNLKMKQTETHKKETPIHCQYAGSRFITLEENPGVYPCIKIFSYGLSTQHHGEAVNVRNLLRPWCVFYIPQGQNIKNLLWDRAYDFLVIADISKIKQIINYRIYSNKHPTSN